MTETAPVRARTLPQTPRDEAARVATAELDAEVALLESLGPDDWSRATLCEGWDVRAMAGHILGQYEEFANPLLLFGRLRRGHRLYPTMSRLDAHNEVQITDNAALDTRGLIAKLRDKGRKSIKSRRRLPGPMRRVHTGRFFPEEPLFDDRLGYMADVMALRDSWMHRYEIAQATGRPFVAGTHSREIVAQVVRDLDREWKGPAFRLVLTGDAGGTWIVGEGEPASIVEADAVDYMLMLSGRNDSLVPNIQGAGEIARAVTTARVVF